eukprot:7272899-Prorocentrum_lima.AAC.1
MACNFSSGIAMTMPHNGVSVMRTLKKPPGPLSIQELRQLHDKLLSMKHRPAVLRFSGACPA